MWIAENIKSKPKTHPGIEQKTLLKLAGTPIQKYNCDNGDHQIWEYDEAIALSGERYFKISNEGKVESMHNHSNTDSCQMLPTNTKLESHNPQQETFSKVTIYRSDTAKDSLNPEKPFVYLDGKKVAKLGTGQAVSLELDQGKHEIIIKGSILFLPAMELNKLVLDVKAGNNYYVRFLPGGGGMEFSGRPSGLSLVQKTLYIQRY